MATVLIVGGAGFIGSHVNQALANAHYKTVVLDNLCRGNRRAVLSGTFIEGDMGDAALLKDIFQQHHISAVILLAALTNVGESVANPLLYYQNNVSKTLILIECMKSLHIPCIYSSSAAVYGMPRQDFITEGHPCNPINPYGHSKLMVEQILNDSDRGYDLPFCSLRYFNATGGDPEKKIPIDRNKQNNVIPILLKKLQNNEPFTIFGTNYSTPDGTCIRDYIHVIDLANAHILALEYLLNGAPSCVFNLGNGRGYSVREVIASVERVTQRKIPIIEGPPRLGDPPILLANAEKAHNALKWKPHYTDLDTMVRHAWEAK